MFYIQVDDDIRLRLHEELYTDVLFQLTDTNRAHIGKYLGWAQNVKSPDDTRAYIQSAKEEFIQGKGAPFNILYQGECVGAVGLHVLDKDSRRGEVGYWLGEAYTGKGIITRAVRTLLDYAFTGMNLNRILIRCDVRNTASCGIATRLGFTHEGMRRQAIYNNNEYCDMNYYALLAQDWTITGTPIIEHPVDDDISLRLLEAKNAELQYALVDKNRAHLGAWMPWVQNTKGVADISEFIQASLKQYAENNGFQAGIWYQNELVGMIGFHYWDFANRVTSIGYWLSAEHTGKGIMTRAVRQMLNISFNTVGLNRVGIECAVENHKSCAIPERLGFTLEGVARQYENMHDHMNDMKVYALLKDDWTG